MNPTTFLTTIYFKILTNCPFLIDAIGDFFGGVGDFFTNDVADFFTNLPQTILDGIQKGILTAVGWLLYILTIAILRVFRVICSLFNVFSGIDNVTYKGEYTRLINVFFENTYVNYVYKGMLIIGIVMCIGFTIAAVIRKMFDSSDKQDVPLGGIILNALKAMLIMLLMTFIVTATINITNTLIQRISLLFDYSMNGGGSETIVFTDQDFAAMGRVYNTIGNYAVNPSYESRYNINSCFNEIRGELSEMVEDGLFELNYVTRDSMGNEIDTWQSVLQKIVLSAPLDNNLNIDVYNPSVTSAILYAMEKLRNDPGFEPLKSYTLMNDVWGADVLDLDTVLFLMGTAEGALNSDYNIHPSMDDAVRGPYFTGEKSIYNMTDVYESFNMEIGGVSYFTIIITSIAAIWQMALIILNCATRIFSMLVMYLISPPIVAVMPFDNGAKFKQWVNAFIVQACGVLGQVVAMRVLMLFIPVVMSSDLDLNLGGSLDFLGVFNFVGKAILIVCILISCRKVSDIINGILADNGGGAASQMENYLGGIVGNKGEGFAWNTVSGLFSSKKDNGGGGGGSGDGKEENNDTPDKANVVSVGGGSKGGDDDGGGDTPQSSSQQKKEFFGNMQKSESERSADTVGQTADAISHPIDSLSGNKGGNSGSNESQNESKNESSIGNKSGGSKGGDDNDGGSGGGGGNSGGSGSGDNSHKPAIAPPTRNNSGKNQNLNPKIFGPSVVSGGNSGKNGSGSANSGSVSNQSTSPFSGYKSPDKRSNGGGGGSKGSNDSSGNSQKPLPDIYGLNKGSKGNGGKNGSGSANSGSVSNQSTSPFSGYKSPDKRSNGGGGGSKGSNDSSGNSQKPLPDIYGLNKGSKGNGGGSGNSGNVSNKSTSPFSGYKSPDKRSNGGGGGNSDNQSLPSKNVGQSASNSNGAGSGSVGDESGDSGPAVDINSSSYGTHSEVNGGDNEGSIPEKSNAPQSQYEDINSNPYDAPQTNSGDNEGSIPEKSNAPQSQYEDIDSNPYDAPQTNSGDNEGSIPEKSNAPQSQYEDIDSNPYDAPQTNGGDNEGSIPERSNAPQSDGGVSENPGAPKPAHTPEYMYRDLANSTNVNGEFSLEHGMKYDENFNIVRDNEALANKNNESGGNSNSPRQSHTQEYMYRDPVRSNRPIEKNLDTAFSLEPGTKYDDNSKVVIDREPPDKISINNSNDNNSKQ